MGELQIRRTGGFVAPRYQSVTKPETQAAGSQSLKSARATVTISESLQQLMSRVSQAEGHARESRRTLQTGESVLAEVQDSLERIAGLALKAAGDGTGRAALQEGLEQLREEIDRMISGASADGTPLFLDEEVGGEDGADALLYAVMGGLSGRQEAVPGFPDWLVEAMTQNPPTAEQLLAALGLDQTAGGAELLAAIAGSSLEDNSAAGYLAALYLGAVIAGRDPAEPLDPADALEGLQQLLEKVSEGVSLDRAVEQLTGGAFTSLADFQAQFTGGTVPGLQEFLTNLLQPGSDSSGAAVPLPSLLPLLAQVKGMNLELMMSLLTAAQNPKAGGENGPEGAGAAADGSQVSVLQLGNVQVMGRDLSGVSLDRASGELTIDGTADVLIRGTGPQPQPVLIAGSGRVTLQNVTVSTLTVSAGQAHILTAGESTLDTLQLREGGVLTVSGGGLLRIGLLHGDGSNSLRLTQGAVLTVKQEEENTPNALAIPILADGPAVLPVGADRVSNFGGKAMAPFDLVWKTLLPNWAGVTSMTLDGTKMSFGNDSRFELARLWLDRNDPSHGNPVHRLIVRGRDESGCPQTRYAYLHWNQSTGAFEEISMYPNPFTVTGGEPGRDWVYEEESQTLRILSSQVTAVSGGSGTDGSRSYFSGRIALADKIGTMELTLGGVICRVSSGRAFSLGQGNDVTLILRSGTDNYFASGAGCAGISLGDGTCLSIDCEDSGGKDGTLTASGSTGGAGIGRDSGIGRDRISRILIRGGVITAAGTGGGAGIGAGEHSFMGTITILGGTVTSTGGNGGGAGIGGALGAAVGDINIHGGVVSASAVCHAAAIGAGIQGECGDILITGTARIVKALGGDPGADIGACLFGRCGNVLISGGADIGGARLRTQAGIPLQMGEDTVTLPRFRLSSRALQLDKIDVLTRESAQAAGITIEADRRWVSQIQMAYSALYHRLEESFGGIRSAHRYLGQVRDTAAADTLLKDVSQSILLQSSQAMQTHSRRGTEDVRQLLE